MKANRARDTAPEWAIRRKLWRRGLRYRVDAQVLKGVRRKADVLFRQARVAVFIDGCFWHGCPIHGTWPKANAEWWRAKIETNRARDRDTDARLRAAGWTVLRYWAHDEPEKVVDEVVGFVSSAAVCSTETDPQT